MYFEPLTVGILNLIACAIVLAITYVVTVPHQTAIQTAWPVSILADAP